MKKRISAMFLTLLMCLCLLPAGVFASPSPISGTCEDGLTWSLDGSGVLTISGSGSMQDYHANRFVTSIHTATSAPWGEYHAQIVKVVIGNSITKIGAYAFYGCNKVQSISLSGTVESIGEKAFQTGYSQIGNVLEKIEVASENPAFCSDDGILFSKNKDTLFLYPVTKGGSYTVPDTVKTIGAYAFYDCSKLTALVIPSNVTTISNWAFRGCTALNELTLSEGLKKIGSYAFADCRALETVTIPKSVNSIGDFAFGGCIGLEYAKFLGHAPEEFGDSVFSDSAYAQKRPDFHLLLPANDSTWINKKPYLRWDRYDIEYYDAGIAPSPANIITNLINSLINAIRSLFSWLPFFR